MATKAELEAELAELKKLFAESRETKAETVAAAQDDIDMPDHPDPEAAPDGILSEAIDALKGGDLEDMAKQIMKELESLPEKKPLLTALGAFVLGYLIGRAR